MIRTWYRGSETSGPPVGHGNQLWPYHTRPATAIGGLHTQISRFRAMCSRSNPDHPISTEQRGGARARGEGTDLWSPDPSAPLLQFFPSRRFHRLTCPPKGCHSFCDCSDRVDRPRRCSRYFFFFFSCSHSIAILRDLLAALTLSAWPAHHGRLLWEWSTIWPSTCAVCHLRS